MNFNQDDIRYMQYALQIAKIGQGESWPNPAVGCVIITNDNSTNSNPIIIGTGYTNKGGVPHAEIMAMNSAHEDLDGATMYVTLEPCCHTGKSKPCTQEIIKNKIKRVVIAMVDPNPLVSGKGIDELKKNGIEVILGCCESEAKEQNLGFIYRVTKNMPKITVKLAVTNDNYICRKDDKRVKITSESVDKYIHLIRAKHDGLLIGSGTYKKDNPRLTVRLEGYNKKLHKFLLSSRGEIMEESNLYIENNDNTLTLITGSDVKESILNELDNHGVGVLKVKKDLNTGRLDLLDAFENIAKIGINNLLIEPGTILFRSLIDNVLPDNIIIFKSHENLGKAGLEVAQINQLLNNENSEYEKNYEKFIFDSTMLHYKKIR